MPLVRTSQGIKWYILETLYSTINKHGEDRSESHDIMESLARHTLSLNFPLNLIRIMQTI